jgi:AcrR family transcriptional regulator
MTPQQKGAAHPSGRSKGTRRRGPELERALLDAAWEVLVENGYSGFTYDAIAARAETSRAVLYRRWPQRRLLLEDAMRRAWVPIELPDLGSLREDAIALLRRISTTRGELMMVLVGQLGDYYRETGGTLEDLRELIGVSGRERPFAVLVSRAVDRGELPAPPATERILDLPMELLRQDMLMRGGPDSEGTLVEIVDRIWLPLLRL